MKLVKMLLTGFMTTLLLFGFTFQAIAAYTYSIDSGYIQHRSYEDGRDFNRIALDIVDSNNDYPANSVLWGAMVQAPNGPLPLTSINGWRFWSGQSIYGQYTGNGFSYDAATEFASGYYNEIIPGLINGIYKVTTTFMDTSSASKELKFNGYVDLPVISSTTFNATVDSAGDLTMKWDKPDLNGIPDTSVRGIVDFYDSADNYIGDIYITMPSDIDYFLVPSETLALFGAYDRMEVGIQLRTNDNNNRSYSTFIEPVYTNTPIPGAFFLFGSGLLALACQRRKFNR